MGSIIKIIALFICSRFYIPIKLYCRHFIAENVTCLKKDPIKILQYSMHVTKIKLFSLFFFQNLFAPKSAVLSALNAQVKKIFLSQVCAV